MTEITIRLQTEKEQIDPAFFDNLNNLAEQYGLLLEKSGKPVIDPPPPKRKLTHSEFIRKAEEISSRIGPVKSDSTDHIREVRDHR